MTSVVTISPVLLDGQWKKDGTNFFRIRLTKGRKSKYIRTNIMVRREQVRDGRPREAQVRYRLEALVRKTETAVASIEPDALGAMDLDTIMEYVAGYSADGFRLDFFDFGRSVAELKPKSAKATYNCALKSFAAFLGTDSLDISRVTSSTLRSWEEWLRRKYGPGARVVSAYPACISYIHGQARLRFNDEECGHVPIKNPFLYYKAPRQKKAGHRVLPEGAVQKMASMRKQLKGRERLGVDVFLISYALMGMNAPDLYSCAAPVNGILRYNRTKTRDRREDSAEMEVRMEPPVKDLFDEYTGKGGYAFNFRERYTDYRILGANVNAGLKKFCERVGLPECTLYWARHTWASDAYRLGVEKGVINDCLCHVDKDMKVTDIYIKKNWEILWKANRKVLSEIAW